MGRAKAKPITRETSTPRGARREAGLHSLYEPGASVRVVVEVEIGLDQFGFHQQPAAVGVGDHVDACVQQRSEEHTSELQSLMRTSYAVFCLKKKTNTKIKLHLLHANKDNTQ